MSAKHTPGPWKVAAIPGSVTDLHNRTIAKVHYGERSVSDANALLIAAAPDLLDVARFVRQLVHQAHHEGPIEDCRLTTCSAAADAIAKATGGKS